MKSLSAFLILVFIPVFLFSQQSENRIPVYPFAISIEHSGIPAIFSYGDFIPDNFEVAARISKQWYLQSGIVNWYYEREFDSPYADHIFYAGITFKLYLFKHAYFTPQWNLSYSKSQFHDLFSTGPTVSFEYFIHDRFSLRLDLFNANIGPSGTDNFGKQYWEFQIYRFLGLGFRYNFNIGKKTK